MDDTLTMGDPDETDSQIQVDSWTFGLVTEETCFSSKFDAIIGLAYPQFAEDGVQPLMDALMKARVLKKNIFTFHLSMNQDEDSVLEFGQIDESKYKGELKYYNVKN